MVIWLFAGLFVDPVFVQGTETRSKAVLSTELRDDGFEDRARIAWSPSHGARFSVSLPFVGRSDRVNRRTGVGDLSFDVRGVLRESESIRVALDGGFTLPTATAHGHLAPGSGSTTFAAGLVAALARERLYASAGARGVIAFEAGRDSASLEGAAGVWVSHTNRTSALVLLEAEAIRLGPELRNGTSVLFTRRERTLSIAPAVALRIDDLRLKGKKLVPD